MSTTAYDHVPKGWRRVTAALVDRLPWADAGPAVTEWQSSRHDPTAALDYIVAGCLRPQDVEGHESRRTSKRGSK